jgi:hypothetical protein
VRAMCEAELLGVYTELTLGLIVVIVLYCFVVERMG